MISIWIVIFILFIFIMTYIEYKNHNISDFILIKRKEITNLFDDDMVNQLEKQIIYLRNKKYIESITAKIDAEHEKNKQEIIDKHKLEIEKLIQYHESKIEDMKSAVYIKKYNLAKMQFIQKVKDTIANVRK